jgi:hypothetical protein
MRKREPDREAQVSGREQEDFESSGESRALTGSHGAANWLHAEAMGGFFFMQQLTFELAWID